MPEIPTEKKINKENSAQSCIHCCAELNPGANVCIVCERDQKRGWIIIKRIGTVIGYFAVLFIALFHLIAIYPTVKNVVAPYVDVKIIAFKSTDRVAISNQSDHDIYLSHIHFESDIDTAIYREVARRLLASQLKRNIEDFILRSDLNVQPFHTNRAISKNIKKGEILTEKFERITPTGLTYVNGYSKDEFEKLIVIASVNKRSDFINTVFFSSNDRRLLQIKEFHRESLNTFPAKGSIVIYSPLKKKMFDIPFEVVGTITMSQEENFQKEIQSLIK